MTLAFLAGASSVIVKRRRKGRQPRWSGRWSWVFTPLSKDRNPHRALPGRGFEEKAGDGLLSHHLAVAVPSALQGLTAVFGMGTGVAPAR